MKNKAIFIVGPTAVGKTGLAFELAQKYNGQLISADSVQVYKGLDIISGKDLPHDSKFVPLPQLSNRKIHAGYYSNNSSAPIHLLDVVEPTVSFNVSDFQSLASNTLDLTFHKRKLPIVVGGTGLYIESLILGLDIAAKPDLKLRSELEHLDLFELQAKLYEINNTKLEYMNNSDRSNPRRLIRAIEISSYPPTTNHKSLSNFQSLVIGLKCKREVLKQRIDKRVDARLKNGAVKEAQLLFENYEKLAQQVRDANGYKQIFGYFKKESSLDEAIYRWKISEYHHAKNQMTWFRKYGNVNWFDIEEKDHKKEINKKILKFLD